MFKARTRFFNIFHLSSLSLLILFSLFFIASSPLIKGNVWVDTNAMLEIGRAWFHGNIPYLDTFEQRGPVFFFFYLIANIIHTQGYFGLFVIEVLNLLAIFEITKKILNTTFNNLNHSNFFSLLIPIFLVLDRSFETGGSPEEFAITWSLLGVLIVINLIMTKKFNIWKSSILFGFAFSIIFWIKFTLVGPLVGASVFLFFYLIYKKEFSKLIQFIIGSLSTLFLFSGLIGVFFKLHGALHSLIDVYFKINIFAYGDSSSSFDRWIQFFENIAAVITTNSWIFALWFISLVILFKYARPISFLWFFISLTTISITYFFGQTNTYSFLLPYSMLLLTFITAGAKVLNLKNSKFWLIGAFALFPIINNPILFNIPYLWKNDVLSSQKFGEYINNHKHSESTSLLYYNTIDFGVERFANISVASRFKYFERTNIPEDRYPIPKESLNNAVAERMPDYIVINLQFGLPAVDPNDHAAVNARISQDILKNYSVVDVHSSFYPVFVDKNEIQYALLKKK